MAHFQGNAFYPYPPRLLRNGRVWGLTLLLTGMGLVLGAQTVRAQAQDGRTILLKAMHFYHTFHSYLGQSNVDTLMIGTDGEIVKHIGSASKMEFQRPNKIFLVIQNPNGSRRIYGDGANFSVYEPTPDQYTSVPMTGKNQNLLTLLREQGKVVAGFDTLFLLTETSLPKTLSNLQFKGNSTCNGHPVYVVTGTTTATPDLSGGGKVEKSATPTYWTWWIDRNSYLLYKVENKTPNVVKPVSFGSGKDAVLKNVKGTVIIRYTVSVLKPDANIAPSEFAFTPPKTAFRKQSAAELLGGKKQ